MLVQVSPAHRVERRRREPRGSARVWPPGLSRLAVRVSLPGWLCRHRGLEVAPARGMAVPSPGGSPAVEALEAILETYPACDPHSPKAGSRRSVVKWLTNDREQYSS